MGSSCSGGGAECTVLQGCIAHLNGLQLVMTPCCRFECPACRVFNGCSNKAPSSCYPCSCCTTQRMLWPPTAESMPGLLQTLLFQEVV
jgi:hypothetical protein